MNHQLDINILSMPSTSGPTIRDYSDIITGEIVLGATVTMGGYDWIVCNMDYTNRIFHLLDAVVESTTLFGNNTNYPGSIIAGVAATFEDGLPTAVKNKLLTCTVSGVTAKVFVPTRMQYHGGFNLFTNTSIDVTRIGYYNGAAISVWTSSPSSTYVSYVSETGDNTIATGPMGSSFGFRPAVCLPL